MGGYENGAFTRRAIVDACKKLFYEKGYHETSYADICQESHVNRGTIYYHFPTREALRLEVQWEYFVDCKHIAERYCNDERYIGIVAMGILWVRTQKEAGMRRYAQQSFHDQPIYTGKRDISHFRHTAHAYMWSFFVKKEKISPMAFASAYGYIASCILLLCEHPEKYDAWEMFEHCARSSLRIWGASDDLIDEIFTNAKIYYDALPENVWQQAGDPEETL